MTNDSNRTLRFSRTAKEAFGHDIRFDDGTKDDRFVGIVAALCVAFLLGYLVGGM